MPPDPDDDTTKSTNTIVTDFQNALGTSLIVKHAKIGNLDGGGDDQATFINKLQVTGFEQIKNYCLMQNRYGRTHLKSPTDIYIRIGNEDRLTIDNAKCTSKVPLYINSIDVGSSISKNNTDISTIQGNITNINTSISNIAGDITNINTSLVSKQRKIQIYNGASHLNNNFTINGFEDSEDTYFERGTLDSVLLFSIRLTTTFTNKLDDIAYKQIRLDLLNEDATIVINNTGSSTYLIEGYQNSSDIEFEKVLN